MELFVYLEMRDGGQPTALKGARVIIFRSNLAELPPPPMLQQINNAFVKDIMTC